jgi:hypothetical protein
MRLLARNTRGFQPVGKLQTTGSLAVIFETLNYPQLVGGYFPLRPQSSRLGNHHNPQLTDTGTSRVHNPACFTSFSSQSVICVTWAMLLLYIQLAPPSLRLAGARTARPQMWAVWFHVISHNWQLKCFHVLFKWLKIGQPMRNNWFSDCRVI